MRIHIQCFEMLKLTLFSDQVLKQVRYIPDLRIISSRYIKQLSTFKSTMETMMMLMTMTLYHHFSVTINPSIYALTAMDSALLTDLVYPVMARTYHMTNKMASSHNKTATTNTLLTRVRAEQFVTLRLMDRRQTQTVHSRRVEILMTKLSMAIDQPSTIVVHLVLKTHFYWFSQVSSTGMSAKQTKQTQISTAATVTSRLSEQLQSCDTSPKNMT